MTPQFRGLLREGLLHGDPRACLTLGVLAAPTDALLALVLFEAAIAKAPAAAASAAAAADIVSEAFWQAAQLHSRDNPPRMVEALSLSLAAGASVRATRQLGLCYLRGFGVARNTARAKELLRAALERLCAERDAAASAASGGGGHEDAAIAAALGVEYVLRQELAAAEETAAP